jgi:hypothetical protein
VELLRDICAIEHAWWSFIASEYDGDFLDRHCLEFYILVVLTIRRDLESFLATLWRHHTFVKGSESCQATGLVK